MFNICFILAACCSLLASSFANPTGNNKYIDGTQYTIKNLGTAYTQRVSDHGQCSVEVEEESKILSEGEIIKIKNKWYKVEDCRLNRAYSVTCGSKLFYQLRDLTCSIVHENNSPKMHIRRQTNDVLADFFDKSSQTGCCESACTITEFLQYCPTN